MSENKLFTKIAVGVALIGLCVGLVLFDAPKEESSPVLVFPAFISKPSEYELNVTAPEGSTHYEVQLSSEYIYLGEEYYDLHEIPENRVITVTRTGKHQIRIYYWVLNTDNYYALVGLGVYE